MVVIVDLRLNCIILCVKGSGYFEAESTTTVYRNLSAYDIWHLIMWHPRSGDDEAVCKECTAPRR